MAVKFDKYDKHGAIHWNTTRRFGLIFNAPLVSRYALVMKRIPSGKIKVLDIGCGDGYLACLIARKKPDSVVIGIDSERQGIRLAQSLAADRGLGNVSFVVNESEQLLYPASSFDVVVMTDVIEHLPNATAMLSEIKRVLVPGGLAIITTPNRQEGSKWDERHDREYTGPELGAEIQSHIGPTEVYGSWPMRYVHAWRRKRAARAILDLFARFGMNAFNAEIRDPDSRHGQLTAVSRASS